MHSVGISSGYPMGSRRIPGRPFLAIDLPVVRGRISNAQRIPILVQQLLSSFQPRRATLEYDCRSVITNSVAAAKKNKCIGGNDGGSVISRRRP